MKTLFVCYCAILSMVSVCAASPFKNLGPESHFFQDTLYGVQRKQLLFSDHCGKVTVKIIGLFGSLCISDMPPSGGKLGFGVDQTGVCEATQKCVRVNYESTREGALFQIDAPDLRTQDGEFVVFQSIQQQEGAQKEKVIDKVRRYEASVDALKLDNEDANEARLLLYLPFSKVDRLQLVVGPFDFKVHFNTPFDSPVDCFVSSGCAFKIFGSTLRDLSLQASKSLVYLERANVEKLDADLKFGAKLIYDLSSLSSSNCHFVNFFRSSVGCLYSPGESPVEVFRETGRFQVIKKTTHRSKEGRFGRQILSPLFELTLAPEGRAMLRQKRSLPVFPRLCDGDKRDSITSEAESLSTQHSWSSTSSL